MGLSDKNISQHSTGYYHSIQDGHNKLMSYLPAGMLEVKATVGETLNHDSRCLHSNIASCATNKRYKDGQCRHCSNLGFKTGKDKRVDYSSYHTYKQPWQTGFGLVPDGVGRIYVGGNTGCQLIVAFALLAQLVHHVVYCNLSYKTSDAVNHRHSHKVVFLEIKCHILHRGVGTYCYRILLHHVAYLGYRWMGHHLLERKHTT